MQRCAKIEKDHLRPGTKRGQPECREQFQVKAVQQKGAQKALAFVWVPRRVVGYWGAGSASEKPFLPVVSLQSQWTSSYARMVPDITGTTINFMPTLTLANCPSIIYHYTFQKCSFVPELSLLSLVAKTYQSPWRASINLEQPHLSIVYNNLRGEGERGWEKVRGTREIRKCFFQENYIAQHLDQVVQEQ